MLQEKFTASVIKFANNSLEFYANEEFDPNVIYADDALKSQIEKMKLLDHQIKTAEKELEAIKKRVKERMGDATIISNNNGIPLCTWSFDSKGRTLFNDKLLKIENPEIYTEYAYVSSPVRKFIIK